MWFDRAVPMEAQPSPTTASSECRRLCDAERDFLCKSITVTQVRRSSVCLLSADDTVSFTGVPGANAPLVPERDSTYSERASCSNGNLRVGSFFIDLFSICFFFSNKTPMCANGDG